MRLGVIPASADLSNSCDRGRFETLQDAWREAGVTVEVARPGERYDVVYAVAAVLSPAAVEQALRGDAAVVAGVCEDPFNAPHAAQPLDSQRYRVFEPALVTLFRAARDALL